MERQPYIQSPKEEHRPNMSAVVEEEKEESFVQSHSPISKEELKNSTYDEGAQSLLRHMQKSGGLESSK